MITEENVRHLVEEKIADTDQFIIDVKVHPGNKIVVLLDADSAVTIADCVSVSRHIESSLDREQEDFELSVSTAGVGQPLQHIRQYVKNIGREVKVKQFDGTTIEGELREADDEGVLVVSKKKEKIEGRKAKQWVETEYAIPHDNIMETKVIISFK